MSPNPGEPEHERRGWTHAICDRDFFARRQEHDWAPEPSRLRDPETGRRDSRPCCYCGAPTDGIYVRQAAADVHGAKP